MAGESRIDILLKSRYDGSGTQSASNELKQLGGAAGVAEGALTAMAGAATLAGAVKFGQEIVELGQLGAQAARIETSFRQMQRSAGQSADATLQALRTASRGAIADSQLELEANRAKTLGVAQNAQQLTELLDVASARGKALGLSTQEAFDNIVTGIGRMSPLILDNLGILTGGQKTFDDYAASIGKSSEQLTDAERKQALFNKVVNDSKSIVDQSKGSNADYATSFERLGASVQNAKEQIGKQIAPGAAAGAGFLADALDLYIRLNEEAEKSGNIDFYGNFNAGSEQAAGATANLEGALNRSEGAMDADADAAQRAAIHTKLFGDSSAAAKAQVDSLTGSVLSLAGALPGLQAHINAQLDAAARARDSAVSALASKAAGTDTDQQTRLKLYADGIATIDDQWAQLNADVRDGSITQDEYALKAAQLGINAGNAFDEITTAQREAESSARKWASTLENDVKKAYDNLKGKVQSVLSGAFNVDVGVDPDKILGRQDAINEPARRLADIAVNGFKSPWLDYFRTDFPQLFQEFFAGAAGDEGVKKNAAQLLKNFEDGLAPELIDKEKAKERVRRMILGEQATDELVKEITDELNQEFGKTAPADLNSLVQQAVGGTGAQGKAGISTEAAGKAFNDAAVAAVAQTGNKVIDTVDEQLRADANLNKLGQAGAIGGTKYGTEFLTNAINNIAQPFIDAVTGIVTKNVIANLNTQNQLQGANP